MLMSEDQRLLRRLHRGDTEALSRIYEKYKDSLLTLAVSVLYDIHTAEDCLHDVFVNFAKAAAGLEINSSLKGYLISCVVNCARNRIKKGKNFSPCQIEETDPPAALSDPAGQLIDNEESTRVFQALAKLSDEQHEVITLHIYGEMKFKEISDFLDISINTVQSRYRYGIEKLRTLL
jgi:RNA polymerase sigma-70 factor (ECF subfamily)